MFADALRELRYHRGRVIATLIAIAISVGFMATVSTFLATQENALGSQNAVAASKADVVVKVQQAETSSATITRAIQQTPGVQATEKVLGSFLSVSHNDKNAYAQAFVLPAETFRWANLSVGRWPSSASEIALSPGLAKHLGGAAVGDKVGIEVGGAEKQFTVSGLTDDPPGLAFDTIYLPQGMAAAITGPDDAHFTTGQWNVRIAAGQSASGVRDAITGSLAKWTTQLRQNNGTSEPSITVRTWPDEKATVLKETTRDFNAIRYILLAFTGVASVVGIIIIATTFTILLAQRRRQIGLMRAVGASGSQVRRRLLAEALLLGAIGSAVGVGFGILLAAVGSRFTGALAFGLSVPYGSLAIEWAIGVVMTVLAAVAPAFRATRVAPLEALRPVATVEGRRRASAVRAVICGLLVLAGAGLAAMSQAGAGQPVLLAVGGALLLSLGVLLGAPLFVPGVIKVLGAIIGRFGSTARLASSNAQRNPARAAATATALMLAVGLIVTLQVGTATARASLLDAVATRYPVDVSISQTSTGDPATAKPGTDGAWLPTTLVNEIATVRNVKARVVLDGATLTGDQPGTVLVWRPELSAIQGAPAEPPAGTVLVSRDGLGAGPGTGSGAGKTVKLTQGTRSLTLKTLISNALDSGQMMLSSSEATKLLATAKPAAVWMTLTDQAQLGDSMADLQRIVRPYSASASNGAWVNISGGAIQSYMIIKVLDVLLMVVTALLGVAVVIALIGVGNTLGLSVIERRRESALLRAMGMQKRSLRVMLLWEALLLALAGVLVGVVFGSFYGWLGISALIKQMNSGSVRMHFSVDLWQTVGMILVAFVAAALASVLPGRRAASSAPVEALADE